MNENTEMNTVNESSNNSDVTVLHLKGSNTTTYLYDWIHSLLFAIAIVIIVLTFFVRLVDVSGPSMQNTLFTGDKVLVTNFLYTPTDGDIVVISKGAHYTQPIIKRVIATEGQSLSIDFDTGEVKVDGKILKEPYIKGFTGKSDGVIPSVVPKGKVFVMGDNRSQSADSRSSEIGLINTDDVIGKAQFLVFPFNRMKSLF